MNYPQYTFRALSNANILNNTTIPTLEEEQQSSNVTEIDNIKLQKIKKQQAKDRKRMTYFKIGYCDFWRKPIHKIINETKKKFPSLSWLRVGMSYHCFCNIRELLQGDLNSKLYMNVKSLDFATLPCNCTEKKESCYAGKCHTPYVV